MRRRRSEKTKLSKKDKEDQTVKRRRLMNNQSPKMKKEKEKSEEETGKGVKFYGCYLLASLCPRFKGHTYIGFTVNPKRRIRQHNGEITSGAFRTKKKRPWEMVLCIHGFPTNVAALQFEWAWQHPRESLAVREAAASFKTLGGLANKIKLALTMLTLHSWQSMDLKVSFFSTKYMKHAAGCPTLPKQMKLHFCSMEELPCYGGSYPSCGSDDEDESRSNGDEQFASDSDERLGPPNGESMESGNIPYTSEHSSDEISATTPLGIRVSLEDEPFSVIDPQENESCPMVDSQEKGSSSMVDTLENESFTIMDPWDNGSSSMMNPVEDNLQSLHQLPVDVNGSIENDFSEHNIGFGDRNGVEELRRYSPVMDEYSSLTVSTASVKEDTAKKDDITCIVIDDIPEEYCEPTTTMPHFRSVDTVRPYPNGGVEIIELCTPSPDLRITACSKRKKFASQFPDIIDLTASPSFVEL